jgi:hypothetical protein
VGAGVSTGVPGLKIVGAFAGPFFASAGYSITHGIAYLDLALEKDTPEPDDSSDSDVLAPGDPNQKTGPVGFGPNGLISATQPIPYTITFVNAASNTAPAHTIVINDQLDSNLDPRTFRLTEVVLGTNTIPVPPNSSFLQTNVTWMTPDGWVQANVIIGVNVQSGNLFWTFTSIDPTTGQPPSDPVLGILPPDNANQEGEARVSYTVVPLASVATGTSVTNSATITFDSNPPITTPAVVNMLDAGTPQSTVVVSNSITFNNTFTVTWSGTDNEGESGLASYNIYVADNGGPFQLWLGNTTLTSAPYTGQPGHTYAFYSIAMDNAGNVEASPTQVSTTVFISTNLPPVVAGISNAVVRPENLVQVKVHASDPNGDQLTFTLPTNAPAGASIRSTNGLFTWAPGRAYANTTNAITVQVTDDGVPPLTTTQTFLVTVLDYLELDLGQTNVIAGLGASLPLILASSDGVTNLIFAIATPANSFTNWALVGMASQIASATVQDQITNVLVAIATETGLSLQGTQQIAQLSFLSRANLHSSFVYLPVVQMVGSKAGGLTYSNYLSQEGTVAVVNQVPLLQADWISQSRRLTLFGMNGTNYQVQYTTNLQSPWQPLFNYTQTNGVINADLGATNPIIFYRLLEQ